MAIWRLFGLVRALAAGWTRKVGARGSFGLWVTLLGYGFGPRARAGVLVRAWRDVN
jgi:hypothetical protein